MNNFSPNMLKTFISCPKKYDFKYLQKISMPQKMSNFEKGKKIHALAYYYLRGDNIDKFETVLNPEEKIIWNNLKNNEYLKKPCIASEYNLSCRIGEYWIGGRLDALVKDEYNYYILDYKTGSIPKNPEYDFQTMVYLLCTYRKFGDNLKFIYIDLKNNQNCSIDFSQEKLQKYTKIIEETCDKISKFVPLESTSHSSLCNLCEYKKICF